MVLLDSKESSLETLGQRLRWTRNRKVWTLDELAEKSGVTKATLSRLENGRQGARQSTIRKLAQVLEVEPSWLLLGDEAGQGKAAA